MKNQFASSTHAELRGTALGYAAGLREQAEIHDLIAKKLATAQHRRRVAPAPGKDRSMADLFEALAYQVHHGGSAGDNAENLLQEPGATLLSVFGPKLAEHLRNARHLVVLEAANIALRNRADDWLHAVDGELSRHARALASNSGLADVLAELESLRKS
ncbi:MULTISPECIES: hypothetical protein [unclassified Stenotrophomonas]|uniref:hypothetical protein n=1 Tax=unclassified Stenotrophomonas TaxID=196198 RepID=UPI00211814E2|nr:MULTISPECIES: hypothetical protein [unclassified Stenotrophomonas]